MKKRIQVLLEPDLIKILKSGAKQAGRSLSGFIRWIITQFIGKSK